MSDEAKLPELNKQTEQDLRLGDSGPAYAERTIQLCEANAQIAALTAQVASKDAGWAIAKSRLTRIHDLEGELAALRSSYADEIIAKDNLAMELAALREDKLRLDWLDEVRPSLIPHRERFGGDGWSYWWSVVNRKRAMGHPLGYVRDIIDQARRERKTSRERILDVTEPNK